MKNQLKLLNKLRIGGSKRMYELLYKFNSKSPYEKLKMYTPKNLHNLHPDPSLTANNTYEEPIKSAKQTQNWWNEENV